MSLGGEIIGLEATEEGLCKLVRLVGDSFAYRGRTMNNE